MSVINDMLRDLDKRQAPEVGGSEQHTRESLIEPQSSVYKKWMIPFGGLLIVMALVYILLEKNSDSTSLQVPAMNSGLKSAPEQALPPTSNSIDSNKEEHKERAGLLKVENQTGLKKTTDAMEKPVSIELTINKQETVIPLSTTKAVSSDDSKRTSTLKETSIKKAPLDEPNVVVNKANLNTAPLVIKADNRSSKPPVNTKVEPVVTNAMAVTLSPIALDQQMAEKATKLLAQQQELDAYRELYKFIGEHEEDTESRTVLASYLLKQNRLAEAGDVLINAPISRSAKLRQIKARWYAAQGKHQLAIYTLASDLPDIDAFSDYYVLLAAYYQRYGTPKEASQTYALLVDYDETIADWWAGLGLAADRNNEKEKAIFAYQQALDLKGLTPELSNFVKPRLQQLLASLPNNRNSVIEKK